MSLTQATAKGNRSYQEDRSFVLDTSEYLVLGVLEGHGGTQCVEFCIQKFPKAINFWTKTFLDYSKVLDAVFSDVNADTRDMHDGCAASVVIIDKVRKQAHVAILGDAPVIIRQGGVTSLVDGQIWIAPEHNIRSNQAEADAIIKRGGFVSGGYAYLTYTGPGLQMSRAFGDATLGKVLNREPEIFTLNLGSESFVMVASDGVIDPAHSAGSSGIEVVTNLMTGVTAQELVDRALAIPTNDNVTALVWRADWTK